MLKRLIIAAVGVVGLVVIGLGIASATVWRADDVLVATTSGGPHTLVTEPGVLELGGDPVTVKVTVPDDGNVVLAVGRDTDVAGWVGTDAHGIVTGLSGWHTLAVDDVAAPEPTPTPTPTDAAAVPPADAATPAPSQGAEGAADTAPTAADPTGSDLWVAEVSGTGSAELEWPAQEGRWSLLAVSTGESAPTLSLAWPRVVTTPWLWPCVVVGALLVLLSGWLLLRDVRRRRAGLDEPVWHPVHTDAIPAVAAGSVTVGDVDAIPVLTRRQLREAAQARASRPRTGAVPKVPVPAALDELPAGSGDETATTAAAASAATATAPTSRRALRTPTGQVAAVPPASARPTASAATTAAAPSPASPSPAGTDRMVPASGWSPSASTAAAAPRSASPSAQSATGSARPTSGAPTANEAASTAAPTGPGRPDATPGPTGVGSNGADQPSAAPTNPDQPTVTPHGRPSWAHSSATPVPTPSAPASDPRGPAGWSAVPPPPGARLRPGSPAGPDAGPVHAGRPTWVQTTAPEPTPADESAAGGSRADAWRRAWGLPPTEGDTTATEPGPDATKEDGR